jgi:hypothetical protein
MEIYQQPAIVQWSRWLGASYRQWLGADLLPPTDDDGLLAQKLFTAPFVVVSHGTEPDPVLNYGNQVALDLWALDWPSFTQTPSRQTAEPLHRDERAAMLAQLNSRGYIDNYQGIRISSRGRRFRIDRAIVWNIIDAEGIRRGQAATFSQWQFLDHG